MHRAEYHGRQCEAKSGKKKLAGLVTVVTVLAEQPDDQVLQNATQDEASGIKFLK